MANSTQNFKLIKPLQEEFYNVDDFNKNADLIDDALTELVIKKAPSGFGLGTAATDISGQDLNADRATGFYRGTNLANTPSQGGWWYVINMSHSDTAWYYQQAASYGSDNSPSIIFVRTKTKGVWSAWKQVATTDGTIANADTVDGKHASAFAPAGFGLGQDLQANGTWHVADANLAAGTGFYYVSTSTNLPSGLADGQIICVSYSPIWKHQYCFEFGPSYSGKSYTRVLNNGTWSAWKQLSTTDITVRTDASSVIKGDSVLDFGPNSQWGGRLRIGGNGHTDDNYATVATSNGNLHMDSKLGCDIYLNYYSAGKTYFGTKGASYMDAAGVFQGTANTANYLWSTTHKGQYYISNAWDGTYWNLTSNHGSPVRVGYADRANLLTSLSGDANYKLGYTADGSRNNAGEWGRVVMRYDPNGQTYGVRVDRADNADTVGGYSADALKNRTAGKNTPVLTPLIDWSAMAAKAGVANVRSLNNAGSGISAYGGDYGALNKGDIYLTQSYRNFDAILIYSCNDSSDYSIWTKWESWELEVAFNQSYRFDLLKGGRFAYWSTWCYNKATANHIVSSPTYWACQEQNGGIIEIYGLNY